MTENCLNQKIHPNSNKNTKQKIQYNLKQFEIPYSFESLTSNFNLNSNSLKNKNFQRSKSNEKKENKKLQVKYIYSSKSINKDSNKNRNDYYNDFNSRTAIDNLKSKAKINKEINIKSISSLKSNLVKEDKNEFSHLNYMRIIEKENSPVSNKIVLL